MIVNQPSGEELLIASLPDNPGKEDLDSSPRAVRAGAVARARVAVAMLEATTDLERYLLQEMIVGGGVAVTLFTAWVANMRPRIERSFAGLNGAMATTPGFVRAATAFETRVRDNLRAQHRGGTVDYHDLVTGSGPVRTSGVDAPATEPGRATRRSLPSISPPWVDLSLIHDRTCKICVGSMQGIHIWIKNFQASASPPSYTATLKYQVRDHFGVDDEDCEVASQGLHGTPGQVAMWVLQHHRRPGHCPWITVVNVERPIQGTLV